MSDHKWKIDNLFYYHGDSTNNVTVFSGPGPDFAQLNQVEIEARLNAYDGLLAALEMILDMPADKLYDAYNIASAAIAAAEME